MSRKKGKAKVSAGSDDGAKQRLGKKPASSRRASSSVTKRIDISHGHSARLGPEYELLRTTLESIGDGFFACDSDWRFVYVNASAERILDIRREEVLGKSHWDVFPLTVGTKLEEQYRRAAAGEARDFENYYEPWGRWFHNRCFPREGGGMSVYFTEITERKRAEDALRRSEERLRLAQAAAGAGVWDWDIRTGKLEWSEELFRLFGLNSRSVEASFDEWRSVLHPDDREQAQGRINKAVEDHMPLDSEYRIMLASGQIRWISALGDTTYDENGAPLRMSGICIDITGRKLAEEGLRRSREDLDRAQEVGQMGWWRLDTQRNVLTWSDENYRIFGVAKGTPMTYEAFLSTVHPDDRQYVDEKWKEGLAGQPYDIEHRIVSDGQVKWVREKAYLEFDTGGALLGGFGITQDITERQAMEARLENIARFPQENPFPVLRMSADGTIIYCNKPGRIVLEQWGCEVDGTAPKAWQAAASEALGLRRIILREVTCGQQVFSLAIAPVQDGGYVNLYGREITQEKRFEQRLRQSNDELEERVKQRTAELAQTVSVLQEEVLQRQAAEQALRASESRLSEAQRIAHLGNWEMNMRTAEVRWSDEVYRIFGLEPDRFGGRYEAFMSYVHPDDRKAVQDSMKGALCDGESYNLDFRIIRPDGSQRVIQAIAEISFDEHRVPIKMVGTVRDITDEKKAEEEIRRNQHQLRELTAELQLTEERERRRIAQDLHDSIGQMLAFSALELKRLRSQVQTDTAQSLEKVIEQLDAAIKQARTLSFDLSPSALYDLGFEVAVEDLLDRISREKGIECRFEDCGMPKPMTEDVKVLLYRTVRELLINALKHANAHVIKVSLLRSSSDIYIKVEDDGCGFDASLLKDVVKDTKGFGIFSIRERLKHTGGHLRIESVDGRGTKAIVIAPLDVGSEGK